MFCANSGSAIIFIIGFQKVFFLEKDLQKKAGVASGCDKPEQGP